MDHIHSINQLREKCRDYNIPLCLIFVDFEKAFDSVEINAILNSLLASGVESGYVKLLKNIYTDCTTSTTLDNLKTTMSIKKGVRQGDTISPKLFTCCLEYVFSQLHWENKGIHIDGEYLNHLKFADDIVIISHSTEEATDMLNDLNTKSRKCGLKINKAKTKIVRNKKEQSTHPVTLDNQRIEELSQYVYLGQTVNLSDNNQSKEITRRIQLGWAAFGKHNDIMRSNLPICLKKKIFDQCILPAMTYASETWTTTNKMNNKLQTTQRAMERIMIGINKKDRWHNTTVRETTKVKDIIKHIKRSKWRWAGHIARITDNRWTIRLTNWIPRSSLRSRGRPVYKWESDIISLVGTTWQRRARNRVSWKSHAEAYIQQWIDNG